MPSPAKTAAQQFSFPGRILAVSPFGSGNVNDTFLVETAAAEGRDRYILQCVNTRVFPRPELIMENLRMVLTHVHGRKTSPDAPVLLFPGIVQTREGADWLHTPDLGFWRALTYIGRTRTFETIRNPEQATEAGRALGRFHTLLHDLDAASLHDTLPGFHVTPSYLARYLEVDAAPVRSDRSADALFCREFIAQRKESVSVLENARRAGELPLRVIHGDPKLANILFSTTSDRAVSIIDLDTIKPGLIHYDIGDCLRSCCNSAGEEADPAAAAVFDLDLCAAILTGYLEEARAFFRQADYRYIYDAVRLIAFELGLRFFTDHLAGDCYFKTAGPGHNLRRALVQFALCRSIENQEQEIRALVEGIARQ